MSYLFRWLGPKTRLKTNWQIKKKVVQNFHRKIKDDMGCVCSSNHGVIDEPQLKIDGKDKTILDTDMCALTPNDTLDLKVSWKEVYPSLQVTAVNMFIE